jgi:hypothetical protein
MEDGKSNGPPAVQMFPSGSCTLCGLMGYEDFSFGEWQSTTAEHQSDDEESLPTEATMLAFGHMAL